MNDVQSRDLDDAEQIRVALQGDPGAFALLVGRYQRRAFTLAARLLGDLAEAEDLVQESFLKVWGARDRYDPGRAFASWFFNIVYRACLNRLRKRRPVVPVAGSISTRDPRDADPEKVAIDRRTRGELAVMLQTLPVPYRAAFVLRHVNDLSIKEIALVLEKPEGTVKTLIHRAREMLRRRMCSSEGRRP